MSNYWLTITDVKGAKDAAMQSVGAAILVASVTTICAVLSMFLHRPILGIDGAALFDAAIFGVAAWRTYRMSRAWAVVGLCMYLLEFGFKIYKGQFSAGLIVGLFFIVAFVNGVRGVFKWHQYHKAEPIAVAV